MIDQDQMLIIGISIHCSSFIIAFILLTIFTKKTPNSYNKDKMTNFTHETKDFSLFEFNMDKEGNLLGPLPFTYELSTSVFPEYHTFEQDNIEEWSKYYEPNGSTLYQIVKEKQGEKKEVLEDKEDPGNNIRAALDFKMIETLMEGIGIIIKNIPPLPYFQYDPLLHSSLDPFTAYFQKAGQLFFIKDPCNYCQLYGRLHFFNQCWTYDYVFVPVKFVESTRLKTDAEKIQNTFLSQRNLTPKEVKEFAALIPDHGEIIPYYVSEISPFIYPLVLTDYFKIFQTDNPELPYVQYAGPTNYVDPYSITDNVPFELGCFVMPSFPEAEYEDMNMVKSDEIVIMEYIDVRQNEINPMTCLPKLLTHDFDCSYLTDEVMDSFLYISFYSTTDDRMIPSFEANNPTAFDYIAPGTEYNYRYRYVDQVATNNQFLFNLKVSESVTKRFLYKTTHPYKNKVLHYKELQDDDYCMRNTNQTIQKSFQENPFLFKLLYPEFDEPKKINSESSVKQKYLPVPPPQPVASQIVNTIVEQPKVQSKELPKEKSEKQIKKELKKELKQELKKKKQEEKEKIQKEKFETKLKRRKEAEEKSRLKKKAKTSLKKNSKKELKEQTKIKKEATFVHKTESKSASTFKVHAVYKGSENIFTPQSTFTVHSVSKASERCVLENLIETQHKNESVLFFLKNSWRRLCSFVNSKL